MNKINGKFDKASEIASGAALITGGIATIAGACQLEKTEAMAYKATVLGIATALLSASAAVVTTLLED